MVGKHARNVTCDQHRICPEKLGVVLVMNGFVACHSIKREM